MTTHPLDTPEPATCGAELAQSAIVPEQLAALMLHVASNLEAHARWVGTSREDAACEHDGLLAVAQHHRAIAEAALQAAATMRGLAELPAVTHDGSRWDRPAFAHWMRTKIHLQRTFAQLLLDHATLSERHLPPEDR
jgi:hypothetical protein